MFTQRKNREIYLDYAATTPLCSVARRAFFRCQKDAFANPAGIHTLALRARKALEDARTTFARLLHVRSSQVVFTASATEANNMVIQGLPTKGHIISTTIEHASVLEPIKQKEREGWGVTYISPDETGHIDPEMIVRALRDDTVLISVILVQNEIGTVQPIARIARKVHEACAGRSVPIIHTDASQAAHTHVLDMVSLRADFLTLSSHKTYGPKGVGVLVGRNFPILKPLIVGGGHEGGMRSGTPNTPAIVGCAVAYAKAQAGAEKEYARLMHLRDFFIHHVTSTLPDVMVNGTAPISPHIVNLSFLGVSAEHLVVLLDMAGIAVSAGSACASQSDASSVVEALAGTARAESAVRFSFGSGTTKKQLIRVLKEVTRRVDTLRTDAKIVV